MHKPFILTIFLSLLTLGMSPLTAPAHAAPMKLQVLNASQLAVKAASWPRTRGSGFKANKRGQWRASLKHTPLTKLPKGATVRFNIQAKSTKVTRLQLRVVEVSSGKVRQVKRMRLSLKRSILGHRENTFKTVSNSSSLRLYLASAGKPAHVFKKLRVRATAFDTANHAWVKAWKYPSQPPKSCTHDRRGIPTCGVWYGAAYQGNGDVVPWEEAMGTKLTIHRTFWRPDQIQRATQVATSDVQNGRIPWVSFKLPYSWKEMSEGKGDAWAEQVKSALSTVPGPVWVALHHEPENDDTSMRYWTALQERLGPKMRQAPNVAFTVILMGWWQSPKAKRPDLQLDQIMPKTKVDVLGLDPYNAYNADTGKLVHSDFTEYFKIFSTYAKAHSMKWGVAETGISHPASADNPTWIQKTYRLLRSYGGVAFSYFNSNLNSTQDWTITTKSKKNDYRAGLLEARKELTLSTP